jgi:hypothetical protein
MAASTGRLGVLEARTDTAARCRNAARSTATNRTTGSGSADGSSCPATRSIGAAAGGTFGWGCGSWSCG